jgi:hypothetical protein
VTRERTVGDRGALGLVTTKRSPENNTGTAMFVRKSLDDGPAERCLQSLAEQFGTLDTARVRRDDTKAFVVQGLLT